MSIHKSNFSLNQGVTIFSIYLFPILLAALTIFPLLVAGTKATFFTVEPDIAYISSAIHYLETGTINYHDHPATPSILLIAICLLPFKVWVYINESSSFLDWSIIHQSTIYFYVRVIYSIVLASGLILFSAVIKAATKSNLASLFSLLSLFSYSYFGYLGVSVASETISLFLIGLWLYIFSIHNRRPLARNIYLLSLISGLLVANKFTNLTYLLATLVLVLTLKSINRRLLFVSWVKVLVISGISFLVSTWPIRSNYIRLFSWSYRLTTRYGPHGDGPNVLFDPNVNFMSIKLLWQNETWPIILMIISLVALAYLFCQKKFRNEMLPLLLVYVSTIIVALAFSKHSLSRYQLTNFIIIVYIASLLLNYYDFKLRCLILTLTIIAFTSTINLYYRNITQAVFEASQIQTFMDSHPVKMARVWEYGYSLDFSYINTPEWYGEDYTEVLRRLRPNLYALAADLKQVNTDSGYQDLFNVCWDQLYLQRSSLAQFLSVNSQRTFQVTPIPYTLSLPMILIESKHCANNRS